MKYLSLRPFVPSGKKFEESKAFFEELGFKKVWDMDGYAGFENNGFAFILQQYDNQSFAENFMLTVGVEDAAAFRAYVLEKQLPEKYGIRIGNISNMPYGLEVNVIDLAGVCWHFVQSN